jgi:translation initiation factor 1
MNLIENVLSRAVVERRRNAVRSTKRKGYIAKNVLRNRSMGRKNKKHVVYSTNPDFDFEFEDEAQEETLDAEDQTLYVSIDRKKRAGKEVTLVEGFVGAEEDLKDLGKTLKSKCGVGGTAKDGEILIQGGFKDKVADLLSSMGYNVKKKGGN